MNDEQQNLLCDGSWEIIVTATDIDVTERLRVKGDYHIGGVMLLFVDVLGIAKDWSDYALWWPDRNQWLLRTKNTLDQCGIHANTCLSFTPMHKFLHIQTPDQNIMTTRADFSIPVFTVVAHICQELGIRYPEELSLAEVYDKSYIKSGKRSSKHKNKDLIKIQSSNIETISPESYNTLDTPDRSNNHYLNSSLDLAPYSTIRSLDYDKFATSPNHRQANTKRSSGGHYVTYGTTRNDNAYSQNGHCSPLHLNSNNNTPSHTHKIYSSDSGINLNKDLINTPNHRNSLSDDIYIRPKTYCEKARMNTGWLNSSLSLMEQNIHGDSLLMLRYKFYTFYDLNPKFDKERIKFIFDQAKLSLISDMIDCTDEEAILFAALQLQANMQSSLMNQSWGETSQTGFGDGVNDIDAALTDLQMSLESDSAIDISFTSPINKLKKGDIDQTTDFFVSSLEIKDTLKILKPKKFPLKSFKTYYCVFKDAKIIMYENSLGYPSKPPLSVIELKGNEVIPDVNVNQAKFVIKLRVPQAKGVSEYWLKFDTDRQYAKWMAACRLAATQGTIHNAEVYRAEMQSILAFLSLQTSSHPNNSSAILKGASPDHHSSSTKGPRLTVDNVKVEDFLPRRMVKKHKASQLTARILEAHHNVSSLSPIEAYLSYIKAWQALPEYGLTYFTVKFMGQKKELFTVYIYKYMWQHDDFCCLIKDLIAIAFNRIIKMDVNTGVHLQTWRFTNMKNWSVNWEIKMVILEFDHDDSPKTPSIDQAPNEEDERVCFQCTCADCKVVHEFIGGYVFMSMRSKEENAQVLDETLFHKLTGGWA